MTNLRSRFAGRIIANCTAPEKNVVEKQSARKACWKLTHLLAMIVFEKFVQHQPLNRQAEPYALEGLPIALSTMADAVGSVCAALDPRSRCAVFSKTHTRTLISCPTARK